MEHLTYTVIEPINLKTNKDYDEKWVQEKIAENPDILNITGGLSAISVEQKQSNGGRLDILMEDENGEERYTVEIQLGATDAEHIIRTVEYWDNERMRNPKYKHYAVIVAEDITSRFLNVISLFNKNIPLIAVQMKAYKIEDKIVLIGTKVLDLRKDVGEDNPEAKSADRSYWIKKSSEEYVKLADSMLELIKEASNNDKLVLNYTYPYIGLASNGVADNFILFRPKRNFIKVEFKIDKDDESDFFEQIKEMEFFRKYTNYGSIEIAFKKEEFKEYSAILDELIKKAIKNSKSR